MKFRRSAVPNPKPELGIHPHFQSLFRWRSKFDWFCAAVVVFIVVFLFNVITSIPGRVMGMF